MGSGGGPGAGLGQEDGGADGLADCLRGGEGLTMAAPLGEPVPQDAQLDDLGLGEPDRDRVGSPEVGGLSAHRGP